MKKIIVFLILTLCLTGCGADKGSRWEAFRHEDIEIAMHAPAADILEALGEPKTVTESPSCAFEGVDKTYYFGSFYLTTYPGKDGERVSGLWFADDAAATPEGIAIGSTREAVETAYGTDGFNGVNAYYLTKDNSKLTIILIDGVVGSVQYEAVHQ